MVRMLAVKLFPKQNLGILHKTDKKIVQCHGCFDVLHIGHIRHLQAAKAMGDILIVSVTSDRFVNKGKNRPIFTAEERAEALCALQCVNYVTINDAPDSVEIIGVIKPNIYAKGAEYKGKKGKDFDMVKYMGGKVKFTDTEEFHTSDLIRRLKNAAD